MKFNKYIVVVIKEILNLAQGFIGGVTIADYGSEHV
jgi:hypothetical protein